MSSMLNYSKVRLDNKQLCECLQNSPYMCNILQRPV